jgi:hypothetical protein
MKSFKDFIIEMGAGAVGGGSPGPTNVTGPQSATDPVSATAVDMRKRKKRKPIIMPLIHRKTSK